VLGGGSWSGVNDDGVVATIVNGMDRLGPLPGKSSRGELVLRALQERDARSAARAIRALDAERYRGFTLLVADRGAAFALAGDERTIQRVELAPGHHMATPDGVDTALSPRYATHFPAFSDAAPPDPAAGDWTSWTGLLQAADENDPHRSMTVVTADSFGTVCSSLLALPAAPQAAPVMLFASGPPTRVPYRRITAPWDRGGEVEG
jgi:hypothetical protein